MLQIWYKTCAQKGLLCYCLNQSGHLVIIICPILKNLIILALSTRKRSLV